MPNRIIKESICASENLNSLSLEAEIFFYRLIVSCDDYGLLDARPQILRAKCFPLKLDTVTDNKIHTWLDELVLKKLIIIYVVDEKPYLKMTKWEKHQQIRSKRSKYPLPDINCNHMISDDSICHRNPIQSNPNPNLESESISASTNIDGECNIPAEIPNEGGAQNENSGKGDYTEDFKRFWSVYPRKIEKAKAFSKWKARLKENISPENIIQAALNYSKYCTSKKTEEQFIKHPSTFLGKDKPFEEYINWQQSGQANGPKSWNALQQLQDEYEEEENGEKDRDD